MNLEQALKRIEQLEAELALSERNSINEQRRLREIIGSWRRKTENVGIYKKTVREGYNAATGLHYKTFSVNLPGDLHIEEVLNYLKKNILPDLYPYTFKKIDYIPKTKSWAYEVELDLNFDIRLEEEFIKRYYENNL